MDAGDWIALGAVVVSVLAAVVSVWQAQIAKGAANEQLELAERIHREQNEPYVVVDIAPDRPGSSLLVLTIQNTGPTMARDVRIQATPELVSTQSTLTPRLVAAVSRPIAMLPPGRRLVYAFDVGHLRFSSDLPMRYDFTVDARGPQGEVEQLTYSVDLNILAGHLVGAHPMNGIEENLGAIAGGLDRFAKAYEKANSGDIQSYYQALMDEMGQQAQSENP